MCERGDSAGARIVVVAAGGFHSMAGGEVRIWGYGGNGCLGPNDQHNMLELTKLDASSVRRIKGVIVAAGGGQ